MSTPKTKKTAAPSLRATDPYLEREREKYEQPLPSREFILELLATHGVPLPTAELATMLDITEEESPLFLRRLRAMERDAEIIINRKNAICVADKLDLIRATVIGHPEGFGFARAEDGSGDLCLDAWEMRKVLPKDKVMVRETGIDRRGRREGKVVEVLDHGLIRVVGRFRNERGVMFVVPEDKRISHEFLVPPADVGAAQPGDVVTAEITAYPTRHAQSLARVVEVLGQPGDAGMEIEIALRTHDLPFQFPDEARAQAEATPQKVKKKDWTLAGKLERVDLRELPLVTIDGETARDFDDAVYCERKGQGWRLLVAIADVSHYVRPGDALDTEARARGTSVYFPRRVIPMLPEELSNGVCSLNPDVERLCMVCDMQVSRKGVVKDYRFYPAVMLSQARFTYTTVAGLLDGSIPSAGHAQEKLLPHLQHLEQVYRAFAAARRLRGAIDFDSQETQFQFDDNGRIAAVVPIVRNDAHRLIEECMLAANVCAADYLLKNEQPALYRVHQGPTAEKLEDLKRFLRESALEMGGGEQPTTKDYAELLERIKLRPDAPLLQTVLLRSMQQAVYTPDNLGHFGLAFEAYAHFTSPIRRYPDLLVHRGIMAILSKKKYKGEDWEQLGAQCSMTERRADDASRDVMNWLKCQYMQDKIGVEFDGTISAVTSFGVFVLIKSLFVEGLVHISELSADYFHYDKAGHRLVGEKTGLTYRLGDPLRIRVVRADMELGRIDFALTTESGPRPAKGRRPAGADVPGKAQGAGKTRSTAKAPLAGKTALATTKPKAPAAAKAPTAPGTRRRRSRTDGN